MTARSLRLIELISVNGQQFEIPVFQRDYSWRPDEECKRFWDDVVDAGAEHRKSPHFLGTIVRVSTNTPDDTPRRWSIVDGQQRLTTLILLLLAMRDHIRVTEADGLAADQLEHDQLTNYGLRGNDKYRLRLRGRDQEVLRCLFEGTAPERDRSRAIKASYDYFLRQVGKLDNNAHVLRGVRQLGIVEVELGKEDEAQPIFESLNATGLELNKSDLIRNFILMGVREPQQTDLYERHWRVIEDLFRDHDQVFDHFARDYLDLRNQNLLQTRSRDVYPQFQRFWRQEVTDKGESQALVEVVHHARHYAAFQLGLDAPAARADRFQRIRRLRSAPAITVMRLLEASGAINDDDDGDLMESLDLIESFLLRRAICGWPTRAYDKVFAYLASRIGTDDPLMDLKIGFAMAHQGYEFPSDQDFGQALREHEIYRRRARKFLLDRLENADNRHPSDTTKFTIEHILPQNRVLSRAWTDMLGSGWREVQDTWLHRLGNLTLTAYNSEFSDRSFQQKKTMKGGFQESALRLNNFVNTQESWTEAQIETRTNALAEQALRIWPALDVEPALLERARFRERQKSAEGRTVADIPMEPEVRDAFSHIRNTVMAFGDGVETISEEHSISFHRDSRFFLEVVPQKRFLAALVRLDIEAAKAQVPARWRWVESRVNKARYGDQSEAKFRLSAKADDRTLETALRLIRGAYSETK